MLRNNRKLKPGCPAPKCLGFGFKDSVQDEVDEQLQQPEPIVVAEQSRPRPPICEDVRIKMCTIPGEDGNPIEIPCHACFEAEDEQPVKDYMGRFCAMMNCIPCGPAACTFTPIYDRSYQRKTFDKRLEPCYQLQKCPEDKPKVVEPVILAPVSTKDYQTKRRSCNDLCCRPLVASRLNLTCTQSPTGGCIVPQSFTFIASSADCPSPYPSKYPKIPNKPITILMQCCPPKTREYLPMTRTKTAYDSKPV